MKAPGYTCPDLDEFLDQLKDIEYETRNLRVDAIKQTGNIDDVVGELRKLVEKLRRDNQELRDYGNYWHERAEELEEEMKAGAQ
jgi:hypothetical protein